MEKPKRRRTDNVIVVPDALAGTMTDRDIAQRAYELYLQRGREDDHDIRPDAAVADFDGAVVKAIRNGWD